MAGLILIALVIVLVIGGIIAFLNGVKFWKILVAFVVILGSYHLYVSHTCGPNSKDVAVMKPLGDAINRYLTTKGKPPSLESIPDLPYKLTCGSPYSCTFEKDGRVYEITWNCNLKASRFCFLKVYSPKTKTGISYWTEYINEKFLKDKNKPKPHIYSSKTSGICNPMKQ